MNEDPHYLRLLSVFHYVVGGIAAFFAFIPIIYVVIGMLAVFMPGTLDSEGEALPVFIGWFFIIIGAILFVLGLVFSVCIIISGRYLVRQLHYLFCVVIAAIECIFMPFGTVLGIFTIVVLAKPSVKGMFEADAMPKSRGSRRCETAKG